MEYQVTARKWRPMVFEDVVGQSHVTGTLRNALATHRVAHAYLFSGTRGCGKTTTARILAKALNCLSPVNNNPDNVCEVCQDITNGRGLDVIEIDGASNRGVDEIRNLRESVRYTPTRGKYKVYIIDEVHMLTKEAFNALLKTLEEPPAHVVFVFATTEVHKVPATILSRCQRFDFRRISIKEITHRLAHIANEEGVKIDAEALAVIAKKGDGSLRDAQSMFDQVRSYCGNEIRTEDVMKVFHVVDQETYFHASVLLSSHDTSGMIALVEEVMKSGFDLREFVAGLAEHLRNLLVTRTTGSSSLVETSEAFKKRYGEEAQHFVEEDLLRLTRQANELEQSIRWAAQPRYRLEVALLQMARMEGSVRLDDLLRQIETLKKKHSLADGKGVVSSTADAPTGGRPTGEVRVVGSVSAGQLKSRAAMTYSMYNTTAVSRPVASASVSAMAPPAVEATTATVAGNRVDASSSMTGDPPLDRNVVQEHWPSFVDDVSRTRIAVGTTLSESTLLEVRSGLLRVSCPDDYHVSTLKRNKEFLTDTFHRITGRKITIEPVLRQRDEAIQSKPVSVRLTSATPAASNEEHGEEFRHPILEVLKRELGAERVEKESL